MANQKDVAKRAGVSSASVSRYLANSSSIGGKNQKKIQKAIEELHYKVDTAAQTLKTGRTHHISIMIPGSAPFYWVLIQSIQQRLSEEGFYSSVVFTRQIDPKMPFNNTLVEKFVNSNQIEAFILFPLLQEYDSELVKRISKLHEHLLIIDMVPEDEKLPYLMFDNYGAGKCAAKEFLSKGHTKILLLTGEDIFQSSVDRKNGFLDCLAEEGVHLSEEYIIKSSFTASTAFPQFINTILPEFTAVFSANDTTAIAFMKAMKFKGLSCPQDYSIIGVDNNLEFTPYTSPSLTSFDQPTYDAGVKAAELVLAMLDKKELPGKTVLPLKLIKRESFN